ncbi:WhiB family transcriptional regulator [Rhodococcus sp. BE178]|uniref:WhiB family transcriptional regulator n=1 Tax=Rhodococcus sp. BE178 TaxID=2817737 RepID=UPI003D1AEF87
MTEQDWRDSAACRGHDPELWFPDIKERLAQAQAKAICAACPVRAACGEWADESRQRFGIWAGVDYSNPRTRPARARRTQTSEYRESVTSLSRVGLTARQISNQLGISERQVTRLRASA